VPRTASEGPANHARVTELLASGDVKKSEAFMQVAREALGAGASEDDVLKKARSISTNFYRIEREGNGGESKPKVAKPRKAKAEVVNGGYTSDVLSTLGQAESAVKAAISQAREQAAELDKLRAFKAKVDALTS